MEPVRKTAPHLLDIQQVLISLESRFLSPGPGDDEAVFEAMTDEKFREVGASGQHYDRESAIRIVAKRSHTKDNADWRMEEEYCQELCAETYLFTYVLYQDARVTRRASLWQRCPDGWKIVYHQGTLVDAK